MQGGEVLGRDNSGTWRAEGCIQGFGGPESPNSESLSCLPTELLASRTAASEQSHQQVLGVRDAVSHPQVPLSLSLSALPLRLLPR